MGVLLSMGLGVSLLVFIVLPIIALTYYAWEAYSNKKERGKHE